MSLPIGGGQSLTATVDVGRNSLDADDDDSRKIIANKNRKFIAAKRLRKGSTEFENS